MHPALSKPLDPGAHPNDCHVGFWLSTYGMEPERVGSLQDVLDARIEAALGQL